MFGQSHQGTLPQAVRGPMVPAAAVQGPAAAAEVFLGES